MVINHEKKQIAEHVAILARKTSQNRVALNAGVSAAVISHILKKNWHHISEDMWRKIKVGLKLKLNWNQVFTRNFVMLQDALSHVQQQGISILISEDAGQGKSNAYEYYYKKHKNVIYLECDHYWTKKTFVENLLQASGLAYGGTTQHMIKTFIKYLKTLDSPLVIIDQFDKLKTPQRDLYMDMYNKLDGNCGFVLSGVRALEKMILRGVNRERIGFAELYSRGGRKFIRLPGINHTDVEMMCLENGVKDEEQINYIFNTCENDYRRVERSILKYHLKNIEQKEIVFEEVTA